MIECVKNGNLGELFSPYCYVYGQTGAGHNWAKGHYTEGAELIDSLLDAIRKEAIYCESLQVLLYIYII